MSYGKLYTSWVPLHPNVQILEHTADAKFRVEQPVGTGFSIGEVKATNEEDIAADFTDFFLNFEKIFGISNFKIYVTGESYSGRYVPYISAAMLDKNDPEYFNLSGEFVNFLWSTTQTDIFAQEPSPTIPASARSSTPNKKPLQSPSSCKTTTSWASTPATSRSLNPSTSPAATPPSSTNTSPSQPLACSPQNTSTIPAKPIAMSGTRPTTRHMRLIPASTSTKSRTYVRCFLTRWAFLPICSIHTQVSRQYISIVRM